MTSDVVRLNEVAQINPSLGGKVQPNAPVSFLGMADLDTETGKTTSGVDRKFGEVAKGYTQFVDGDLLLAKITPCFENGKIAQAVLRHTLGAGSTEFHVIRPDRSRLNHRYLLHYLRQPRTRVAGERRMTGSAGQRRVPENFVANLEIPLLPLIDQQRIAAVLDQTDALRERRRASITLLEELAQSIFLDMFGELTAGFPTDSLGERADIQGGLQVTAKRRNNPLELPYLRVANVYRNRLDLREIKVMRVTERELARTHLAAGDLLVVEGHGNPDEIGRVAVWDGSIEPCIHQNHLIRVRLDASSLIPDYAAAYLNSAEGRRFLLRAASTTSGLHTISTSDVRHTPIKIPPLRLQRLYQNRVNELRSLRAHHERHLRELDDLFESLRQRAFRGELWQY
ncbi:restriction endonuclease subunit S [Actinomadura decatromicini]|uniref:Type I restriction modification DNA specificity domain-containing protein n=1 Tax=Actinomadura decatromicini TaxID=2604572 RepID=A0A5D3FY78_9ACTN|nr:restriction endonuclease subunit S [Actinomadura decatromicini]TYK53291.1 hypothetical protein FXF68_06145 [Actinomadura decatromicini]